MTSEFALIRRLREQFPTIGDDAAVVEPPTGPLLLAADAVVAGVHAPPDVDPADLGWEAVVVNISDIAAMGGRPLHLLVTVTAPRIENTPPTPAPPNVSSGGSAATSAAESDSVADTVVEPPAGTVTDDADSARFPRDGASALTAAELRLLPMLATHLPVPEIAADLFLSPHTIKSQMKSIYRKLDSTSRTQTVTRARELGLLEG